MPPIPSTSSWLCRRSVAWSSPPPKIPGDIGMKRNVCAVVVRVVRTVVHKPRLLGVPHVSEAVAGSDGHRLCLPHVFQFDGLGAPANRILLYILDSALERERPLVEIVRHVLEGG